MRARRGADRDGDLDLFYVGYGAPRMYWNHGNGYFAGKDSSGKSYKAAGSITAVSGEFIYVAVGDIDMDVRCAARLKHIPPFPLIVALTIRLAPHLSLRLHGRATWTLSWVSTLE